MLRNTDPRLPFALSSVALIVVASSVLWAEKHLAKIAKPQTATVRPITPGVLVFFGAVALLGLGYQVHFALNAAPQYLRFAKPADLELLMPVFWIGFNLLMFPAQRAATRPGACPSCPAACPP